MEKFDSDTPVPKSCFIADDGRALHLVWDDGSHIMLDAELLWLTCPSAVGKRRRLDGLNVLPVAAPLRLVALQWMGRYAVNLTFSDGHDRGIYPWRFLVDLAKRPTVEEFITPAAGATLPTSQLEQEGQH